MNSYQEKISMWHVILVFDFRLFFFNWLPSIPVLKHIHIEDNFFNDFPKIEKMFGKYLIWVRRIFLGIKIIDQGFSSFPQFLKKKHTYTYCKIVLLHLIFLTRTIKGFFRIIFSKVIFFLLGFLMKISKTRNNSDFFWNIP